MTKRKVEPATQQKETVTVCSACKRASCWNGIFYCDDYKKAGTIEMTVADLRKLGLEHPDYYVKRQL